MTYTERATEIVCRANDDVLTAHRRRAEALQAIRYLEEETKLFIPGNGPSATQPLVHFPIGVMTAALESVAHHYRQQAAAVGLRMESELEALEEEHADPDASTAEPEKQEQAELSPQLLEQF